MQLDRGVGDPPAGRRHLLGALLHLVFATHNCVVNLAISLNTVYLAIP
jgi:hypothetical protein